MGEKITIIKIEILKQEKRTLLQIDIWFEKQKKGGRIFIETGEFFRFINNSPQRDTKKKDNEQKE